MGQAGRGQLVTVVTGVWGGMSLSRLRDVAANGNSGNIWTSPQRSELSCICPRHLPALDYIFLLNFSTKKPMAKLNHHDRKFCRVPFVLGCWWALGQPFSLFLLHDFGASLHTKHFALCKQCSKFVGGPKVFSFRFSWQSLLSLFKVFSISFAISFRII